MKTYNSFSIRRVALLVKRDVVGNWKQSLWGLGIAIVVFLILMYMSLPDTKKEWMSYDTGLHFNYWEDVLQSFQSVWNIALMFLLANAMGNLATKGGRTDYLILPARNDEKFLARYLYVLLQFVVVVVVGFLVADILHLLIFPLLGYGEYREVCDWLLPVLFQPGAWDTLVDAELISRFSEEKEWVGVSFVCAINVVTYSTFVLGGNLWRKHPFLKTWGVGVILVIASVLLGGILITKMLNPDEYMSIRQWFYDNMGITYDIFILMWSAFFMVLTVLFWRWAFRLFCRSQVVEPKRFRL